MSYKALLAAALVATILGGAAMADAILPTGLAPGSQYQILFVTTNGTTATSSNIADYNSFVTQEANHNLTLQSLGATWTAVASTATINANQASNTTNIPIYDTQGNLLEPNFPSLFTDTSFLGPEYDQQGNCPWTPGAWQGETVWTGSWLDGTAQGFYMGGMGYPGYGYNVQVGYDGRQVQGGIPCWICERSGAGWGETEPTTYTNPLYAISSPITVPVPEPGTLTLLVSELLGLAGAVYLRRRRAKV